MTAERRIDELEEAKQRVVAGIDHAIVSLKGSIEFRDAVEHLLVGTPFEKPVEDGKDVEGLYGRLRNALKAGKPAPPLIADIHTKLDELGCGESHNTGFGCCRCTRNDTIEDIKALLAQI
jgi:hypothetical protein